MRFPFFFGVQAALCSVLAAGCAGVVAEQRADAGALAGAAGWTRLTLPAGAFDLVAYAPAAAAAAASTGPLTIYIEGDGHAWRTPNIAADDPTPLDPVGLRLALRHPSAAVAYLARPCQYLATLPAACKVAVWTDGRYAEAVIAASERAIEALKRRAGASRLVLVGYSGGGAVAALVAARRDDVDQLVTVAANLDNADWTRRQRLQPLTASLNPADAWRRLQATPQRHFVGADDRVVDPGVARAYAARFPLPWRPQVVVVPGFDHRCCWVEAWPRLWLQPTVAPLDGGGAAEAD